MTDRIQILDQILKYTATHHIRLNRFWANFIETARFKLGESIKDIKIPYALSSEAAEIVQLAIGDFLDLLRKRHETQFKAPEDRSIDDFDRKTKLPPRTFYIRQHRPGTLEYQIITKALATDPLLDAGIFETWFSPQNNGHKFLELISGIYHKSLTEEIKGEHFEKITYISHLALLKQCLHAKELIKEKGIKGIKYEHLDVTFGNLLAIIFSTLVSSLIDGLKIKRLPADMTFTFLLLCSTCHPLIFTAIKNSVTRQRFNPYLIPQDLIDLLDPLYRKVSQENTDLTYVYQEMSDKILGSTKLKTSVMEEATLVALRGTILDFLFESDNPNFPLFQSLRELLSDHTRMYDFLADPKAGETLAEQIHKLMGTDIKDPGRLQQLQDIEMLLRLTQRNTLLKRTDFVEEWVKTTVRSYLTYKIDLYLDRFTSEAVQLLDNRQLKMEVPQLKQDYENGRLYRIAADSNPTLQQFMERFEGQLFIDLKDFTKRTNYSKEIVMADFLGTEFYKPILDAAKKHYSSMSDPDKTIKLTNLLGDAVIFSGNIEALVYLARDIQDLFREYKNKLKASNPSNLEKELKEPVEESYKQNSTQIQSAIDRNRSNLEALRKEVFTKIKNQFAKFINEFSDKLNQELLQLEADFLEWDVRIHAESDPTKRYEIVSIRNQISQRIITLRGIHKQYVSQFQTMNPEQQMSLLAKFYFREPLLEIQNLEESLESLQKSKSALLYEYERDIKKIEGFGMEAGLFISYGTAAEIIQIRDEAWSDQSVAIAETINESARGTARNQLIKKLLDARLAEQIRLRGKPDLVYPFHVYVEKTFSFQMSPQQSAEFQGALKNRNFSQAEQILHNLHYESLKALRDQIQYSGAHHEQAALSNFSDIYNEGEAISEDALNAFLRETSTHRHHFRKTFPVRRFHQQILEQFLFLTDSFQFILSMDHDRKTKEPFVFRFAGEVTFRGFESHGAIGIYEILGRDSNFYRLLLQHHVADWIHEFDAKVAT